MGYGDLKYWLDVKDARTDEKITSNIYTFVYQAGTKTLATLYSNDSRGTLANPITTTQFAVDDRVEFYAADTSVDVYCCSHADGREAFVESVTPQSHVIKLYGEGAGRHMVIPFADSDNTEVDTGVDIPYGVEIYRAAVEVVTVDSGETLDVGLLSSETAGDADGLLAAVSVASTGLIQPWDIADTTTEDYTSPAYYGALMGTGTAGTSTANDTGNPGGSGHYVTGSNAVSVTYTGSSGSDTAAGYIHLWFRHIR